MSAAEIVAGMAAGSTILSTVAARRTPTGRRPISSAALPEAIRWGIARQMRGSDSSKGA
jgi:hypothetical protein